MSRIAYYNGPIYTADCNNPIVDAFVVDNGRFVYVGSEDGIGECEEKIDLEGRCVIPGLIDSHCHMFAGVVSAASNMIFVEPDTKPSELGNKILALLEESPIPDNQTIVCMGIELPMGDFNSSNIDSVIPDRPVVVFANDGHALLLNTPAMKVVGISRDTPDPSENSYYVRDDNGDPTGLVIEIPAMRPCVKLITEISMETRRSTLKQVAQAYSSLGYTGLFEASSIDSEDCRNLIALVDIDQAGELPLRVSTSFNYGGEENIELDDFLQVMENCRTNYSSANVIPDTLKLISDGTVEEQSALLFEPYCTGEPKESDDSSNADDSGDADDQPGSDSENDKANCGSEIVKYDEMKRAAELAADRGFSVHIHAIGDKAVCRTLDILTSLGDIKGTKTIAHNQLYRPEEIEKIIQAKDIFFQTTPHWATGDKHTLRVLGEDRYKRQFPIASALNGGVAVTLGSDSCLEEETSDAFKGIYYACTRGAESLIEGQSLPPKEEAISRMDALMAYTINGAKQLSLEDETGSITEGKSADFLIIDNDIINCSPEELWETEVLETHFRGKQV